MKNKTAPSSKSEKTSQASEKQDRFLEKVVTIYLIVLIALVWLVPYPWMEKLSIWMNHREIERRLPPELKEKFGPFGLQEDVDKIFKEAPDEGTPLTPPGGQTAPTPSP